MSEQRKKRTPEEFLQAMDELFASVPPETPEEVDAVLRAAGLDPDEVGRRGMQVAFQAAMQRAAKAEDALQELQAANAALRAALDTAHVCKRCLGDGGYVVGSGTAEPEQEQCEQCDGRGIIVPDVPDDVGRQWQADARAATGLAALYRREMQTLFDGLKVLRSDQLPEPRMIVSHLCTQLALWLGEPDSEESLARAKARGWLEEA